MLCLTTLSAQSWDPIKSAEKQIAFEGRKHLFNRVFQVTTIGLDTLQTNIIWKDNDASDGLMVVIESYLYNSKKGVVITTWNESAVFYSERKRNYVRDKYITESNQFSVTHIDHIEFSKINDLINEIHRKINNNATDGSYLRKFSDSITIEYINSSKDEPKLSIWIDGNTSHSLRFSEWESLFAAHLQNVK